MASYLPLNMLKKYINIFEPNKLKFIILDDIKEKLYYEEIINTILSDYSFDYCNSSRKNILLLDYVSRVLKKYDVNPKKIKHYKIQNISNIEIFHFYYFQNTKIYENKKDIRTLPKYIFPFHENLLSNQYTLNSILYDPEYLLNLNIKLIDKECIVNDLPMSDKRDKQLLYIIYILFLLYNKKNYLIIKTLLLYINRSTKVIIKNNKLVFLPFNEFDCELRYLTYDVLYYNKNFTKYVDVVENFNQY